jgi:DNA-binding NarL/FixJ family response regulator
MTRPDVVLVDTDEQPRATLRMLSSSFEVRLARSEGAAWLLIGQRMPDVVVLDRLPPDGAGAFLGALKRTHPWIRCVLLVTGPHLEYTRLIASGLADAVLDNDDATLLLAAIRDCIDRVRRIKVVLVETDPLMAAEIALALGSRCRVQRVGDPAQALIELQEQLADILIAGRGLAPYGAELLLEVARRLYPHVRRVLCANLPRDAGVRLCEQGVVHAVVPRMDIDRARFLATVLGGGRARPVADDYDAHCTALFSKMSDLARDAGVRLLDSAVGTPTGREWTTVRRDAARLLRASAAHALALANEIERVEFVACPACQGAARDCSECRGQGELLRVRGGCP